MGKPKALLIAEKPSVAQSIENAYQKIKDDFPYDVTFLSCAGHLIGLCLPDEYEDMDWVEWKAETLPLIPDNWKTKIINNKYLEPIRDAYNTGEYDVIINAGDAGREGELIMHRVYQEIGVTCPILRYWADDVSEPTILKTLNNLQPSEDYNGLKEASILRSYLDWLVGMNFSRAASLSLDRKVSVGRVMTPSLAMIVKREKEIQNFTPTPYFELEASFVASNGVYKGKLINTITKEDEEGNQFRFLDKTQIEEIKSSLEVSGTIDEVTTEEKLQYAPSLFNLTDLQKECSNKFNYPASKTLKLAQSLYDKKLLSYPRTESKHLSTGMVASIPLLLESIKCIPELESSINSVLSNKNGIVRTLAMKKYVNDAKVVDHPALTPTSERPEYNKLSTDEKNVYNTVAKRFLSIFLPPKKTSVTKILTNIGNYQFKTSGTVLLDKGYTVLYNDSSSKDETLPNVSQGESVTGHSYHILEKETVAPKRYTVSTLLSAMETAGRMVDDKELERILMESSGLGTAATRAEIIDKLFEDEYITTEKKSIIPTPMGIDLITALGERTITSPILSAQFEQLLKKVENNECSYDNFYNVMLQFIKENTADLLTLAPMPKISRVVCSCPKCGEDVYAGKKSYFCLNAIDEQNATCDFFVYREIGKAEITPDDVRNLVAGQSTSEKNFVWKSGKKSKSKLKLSDDYKITFDDSTPEIVGECPKCSKPVYIGKLGFYCEGKLKKFNTCDFSIFGKVGETPVKKELFSELLRKGETSSPVKIKFKSGSVLSSKIRFNENYSKLELVDFPEPEPVCECPYCNNGTVMSDFNFFKCSNSTDDYPSCDFKIYRIISKTMMTNEEFKTILSEGKVNMTLTSKAGKSYQKDVYVAFDTERKRYTLKFDYDD